MRTVTSNNLNIEVVADPESLARRALDLFVGEAKAAIAASDGFRVAISGGNTPRRFFELLGTSPQSEDLAWDKVHLFWVDERYVPADSPSSNYSLAAGTFLAKVAIPGENIHPIPTNFGDFQESARCYEQEIKKVFGLKQGQLPGFDLILLGMGADGHTGSLLVNSYAPFDSDNLACVVYVMGGGLNRITMTHPVLRSAARLAVVVCGSEKASILKEVLTSEPDEVRYPIHVLWPVLDRVTWLVDKAAAAMLETARR
jgi:6-phosphogluconolactonase